LTQRRHERVSFIIPFNVEQISQATVRAPALELDSKVAEQWLADRVHGRDISVAAIRALALLRSLRRSSARLTGAPEYIVTLVACPPLGKQLSNFSFKCRTFSH